MVDIQRIKANMPVMNPQAANRLEQSRAIALQQAVSAAPATPQQGPPPSDTVQAQQIGTGLAKMGGDIQAEQAQQNAQLREGQAKRALTDKQESLKQSSLTDRYNFNIGQGDLKYFNNKQLSDWTRLFAKDKVDFQIKQQKLEAASKLKMMYFEAGIKAAENKLDFLKDKELNEYALEQKQALTDEISRLKQELANTMNGAAERKAVGGLVFGAVGGVVGGYFGGPAGAAGGFAAGSGVGSAVVD